VKKGLLMLLQLLQQSHHLLVACCCTAESAAVSLARHLLHGNAATVAVETSLQS
jgi:hypothetical protein